MAAALALAPLTLAAVLVLSGLAKRGDPAATHSMMVLLRLPAFLTRLPVARALPWVELAVAALLLTPWQVTYAVGAVAALGLFLAFWVVVARAMTFDPRPTCGCFGRVGDHRISARTVLRNTLLLALAVVSGLVALRGGTGTGLLLGLGAGDWLWLLMAAALAAVTYLVLAGAPSGPTDDERQAWDDVFGGASAGKADGGAGGATGSGGAPAAGELDYVRTPTPRGVLVDRSLETTTLHALARHQAQLVVLANCWCGTTVAAVDRLPGWRERLPDLGVPLVHTLRPFDEPRLAGLQGVWWDPGGAVYEALRAGSSPAAVLLGADGLLAGGPVSGLDEIEELVDDIATELAAARGAEEPAPAAPRASDG